MPGPRSDVELLTAHAAGDPYAFEELFRRHHRQLIRTAARRSRSPEDAADAVQEAMLAAHRGAPDFRQHCEVHTWLHRIVVNKCIDQLRRPHDRVLASGGAEQWGTEVTSAVDTMLVVHRALNRLTAEHRAAVVAVDMHGYSIADAARLLGVAPGTVKSRCARGRARLAVFLAELEPIRRHAA